VSLNKSAIRWYFFYGGRTLKVPVNLAFVQRRGIGHPLFWILKPHTKKYK
jgi:hypothetical protein